MIQLDTVLYSKVGHICLLSHSRLATSDKTMLCCLTGWWGRTQAESSAITQRHGDQPYGDGRVAGGGIVNDCDIAHLSNVVQWTMGSQLLGEKHTLKH